MRGFYRLWKRSVTKISKVLVNTKWTLIIFQRWPGFSAVSSGPFIHKKGFANRTYKSVSNNTCLFISPKVSIGKIVNNLFLTTTL